MLKIFAILALFSNFSDFKFREIELKMTSQPTIETEANVNSNIENYYPKFSNFTKLYE